MQIQLTKTKSITIGGGGSGGSSKKSRVSDVVGIDMFTGDERGFPAVRLTRKKGGYAVTAVGFVPPPSNQLPDTWDALLKNACSWSLPSQFQASQAALVATSPDMFAAQTTMTAFKADLARGGHQADDRSSASRTRSRFGLKRDEKPKAKSLGPAPGSPAPLANLEALPGEPISNGGTRFVMQPISKTDGFVIEAGLPEYQLLWLSRLLPEGKRPTASSIQVRTTALAASVLNQPEFVSANGCALALFVGDNDVHIAGYNSGELVLWRKCQDVPGWLEIREAVKIGLGLDDEMVDGVLDDSVIDPKPVMEPYAAPILDELVMTRDYMAGKFGFEPKSALIMGIDHGGDYWSAMAEERVKMKLIRPTAFDGLIAEDQGSHTFLAALGGALALINDGEG